VSSHNGIAAYLTIRPPLSNIQLHAGSSWAVGRMGGFSIYGTTHSWQERDGTAPATCFQTLWRRASPPLWRALLPLTCGGAYHHTLRRDAPFHCLAHNWPVQHCLHAATLSSLLTAFGIHVALLYYHSWSAMVCCHGTPMLMCWQACGTYVTTIHHLTLHLYHAPATAPSCMQQPSLLVACLILLCSMVLGGLHKTQTPVSMPAWVGSQVGWRLRATQATPPSRLIGL